MFRMHQLVKACLAQLADWWSIMRLQSVGSNKLSLTSHHSVMDGWSVQVLLAELTECYEAVLTGGHPDLPPLQCQYTDFSHWQVSQWESGAWSHQVGLRLASNTYNGHFVLICLSRAWQSMTHKSC